MNMQIIAGVGHQAKTTTPKPKAPCIRYFDSDLGIQDQGQWTSISEKVWHDRKSFKPELV